MSDSIRYVGTDKTGKPSSFSWSSGQDKPLLDWEAWHIRAGVVFFGRGPGDVIPIVTNKRELMEAMAIIEANVHMVGYDVNWSEWNAYMLPGSVQPLPGPRKPLPAIPPEVWNDRPIDPDVAMEAVRASSKSGGSY